MKSSCLFTLSAPSGAGKTSLVKALLEKTEEVTVCVSHATRAMRPGEVDGRDYHFITVESFEQMVDNDEFLEHAKVFDNYYGTSQQEVEALLAQGSNVILEIDWQGARQVKQKLPDTVAIFILPPSREVLKQRLTGRGTDDDSVIERRMRDADNEMSHYNDAEYLIINDDFSKALYDLESVIHSQTLTLDRQKMHHGELIASIESSRG